MFDSFGLLGPLRGQQPQDRTMNPHQKDATISFHEVVFGQTVGVMAESAPQGPSPSTFPALLQPAKMGWGHQAELIISDISC